MAGLWTLDTDDGVTAATASSSPDVAVGTIADGATADAASAADGGVGVDTVPIPAATAFPNAGHVSSFLLHIYPPQTPNRPFIATSTGALPTWVSLWTA